LKATPFQLTQTQTKLGGGAEMLIDIELGELSGSHVMAVIPGAERNSHVLIKGGTGTGKTRCIKTMLHQDLLAIAEGKQDPRIVVITPDREELKDVETYANKLQLGLTNIYSEALLNTISPQIQLDLDDLLRLLRFDLDMLPERCNQVLDQCGLLNAFKQFLQEDAQVGFLDTRYRKEDTLIGAAFLHYLACNMDCNLTRPIVLYIDEFARYAACAPHAVAKLFQVGQKHGISLIVTVLSMQSINRLDTKESPTLSEVVSCNSRFQVKMLNMEDRDTFELEPEQAILVTPQSRNVFEMMFADDWQH
jgi:hypothetical protein